MASHKLQRLMKNLSVDTLQAIPTKDLIDMAKDALLEERAENGWMGLSAPIEDHEVHRFATDISMKLLEEVCTKLEVTDQPLEYSTQEIVKPIVIAHKFAKLVPTDNLNASLAKKLQVTNTKFNESKNLTIKRSSDDLEIIVIGLSSLVPYGVFDPFTFEDIKSIAAVWRVILKLAEYIHPQYIEHAKHRKRQYAQVDKYNAFVDDSITILNKTIVQLVKPAFQLKITAKVAHRTAIFLANTLDNITKLYGIPNPKSAITILPVLFGALDFALEALQVTNNPEYEQIRTLRTSCSQTWERFTRYEAYPYALDECRQLNNPIRFAIDVSKLFLEPIDPSPRTKFVEIVYIETLLNRLPSEAQNLITDADILDEFSAVGAAYLIKSTSDSEWYYKVEAIFVNALLSKVYLKAYAAYNVWVIYLRHAEAEIQMQHYRKWAQLKESLTSVAEDVSQAFINKLLNRIFAMLPEQNQIDIVSMNRTKCEWITNFTAFECFPDTDIDKLEEFAKHIVSELRICVRLLDDENEWESVFGTYKWIRAMSFFRVGLHDPIIYPHLFPLIDDDSFFLSIIHLLNVAISTRNCFMQSLLYPIYISGHMIFSTDQTRKTFAKVIHSNEAIYELISYTNRIIRANNDRTGYELPNLAAVFKITLETFDFEEVIIDRLVRLQLLSKEINTAPGQFKLDILNPTYVQRNVIPAENSYLICDDSSSCNLNACYIARCSKTAIDEFHRCMERVESSLEGMQRVFIPNDKDGNVQLAQFSPRIAEAKNLFEYYQSVIKKTNANVANDIEINGCEDVLPYRE